MNFLASLTQGISSQVNKVINAISFSNAWMYVNQTKTRIIANIVQYSIRRDPNIHFEINLQDYPLFLLNHPNPKLNDFKNKGIYLFLDNKEKIHVCVIHKPRVSEAFEKMQLESTYLNALQKYFRSEKLSPKEVRRIGHTDLTTQNP